MAHRGGRARTKLALCTFGLPPPAHLNVAWRAPHLRRPDWGRNRTSRGDSRMKRFAVALAPLAVSLAVLAPTSTTHAQTLTRTPSGPPVVNGAAPSTLVRRDTKVSPAQCCAPSDCCPAPNGCDGSCCDEGYCEGGCCCPGGCCDGGYGCDGAGCSSGCGWGNWCNLCPTPGSARPWFVTADYIYVRANLSEAPAFEVHDESNAPTVTDTFHDFDFQYQSSYRFGCGYQLPRCGEQVRFLFTRMSSSADAAASSPTDTIRGPFDTDPGPGGTFTAHAQVNTWSYDVEFAKTIPLGGSCNSCCGDCCRPSCPAWDVTWEGGFRFAQVRNSRSYLGVPAIDTENPTLSANTDLDFQGGGPRFGLEGRRYFGSRQWLSAYLKGDISLLMGHVDVRDHHLTSDTGSTIDQTATFRNIIPVTEIEAGLTGQLTRSVNLSAGYLFSAWNDLGFRDEFNMSNVTALNTGYDDANILAFDGFFARLEVDF
jgi:hypothetical protein